VQLRFLLEREVSDLDAHWRNDFLQLLSNCLNVSRSRLVVVSIQAGSAVVTFRIDGVSSTSPLSSSESSPQQAANVFIALYAQTSSPLRRSTVMDGAASETPTQQTVYPCDDGSYAAECGSGGKSGGLARWLLILLLVVGGLVLLLVVALGVHCCCRHHRRGGKSLSELLLRRAEFTDGVQLDGLGPSPWARQAADGRFHHRI